MYLLYFKRLIDVVLSLLALAVLSPIMILVAIILKYISNGSIIFKSKRMGLNKKTLTVYKFRTMHPNSDKFSPISTGNDIRITTFGKILRKSKVDELPQLLNILLGDMSIIGPRPESYDIAKKYYTGKYTQLFTVRPGLTSPGTLLHYLFYEDVEVPLGVDNTDFYINNSLPKKLEAELKYCRGLSLLNDLKIVYYTITIIMSKWLGIRYRWKLKL